MKKRAIAVVLAGVLALLGVLVLVKWAQGANDRAYDGAKLVSVVRTTQAVGSGTTAEQLATSTEIAKLPADSIPHGAVTGLSQVAGLATSASLQKGEVLLKSRMAAPGDRGAGKTSVPKGYQEISVAVDAQHGVAGAVKAGDRVGLIATFEPRDGEKSLANLIRQDVLVTKVSGAATSKDITSSLLTIAVKTADAENVAFAADFGRVWLTLQNADTDKTGEKPITMKDFAK